MRRNMALIGPSGLAAAVESGASVFLGEGLFGFFSDDFFNDDLFSDDLFSVGTGLVFMAAFILDFTLESCGARLALILSVFGVGVFGAGDATEGGGGGDIGADVVSRCGTGGAFTGGVDETFTDKRRQNALSLILGKFRNPLIRSIRAVWYPKAITAQRAEL